MDTVLSAVTRHWTISGTSRFQSGAYSTVNFAGIDSNGDGSAANDRPLLSNPSAGMSAIGIDGVYLGADQPGTYYDMAALNNNQIVQIDPNKAHWLIPFGQFLLEKAIPTSMLHLERGQFIVRAEAQNVANHNNVGLLDVNLLDAGTSSFMNTQQSREANGRALRFWAKFVF
jgi:hypothetical protein